MTRFGAPYEQCGYCGKWVKMSGFFAGLHVCVDDETRQLIDRLNDQSYWRQQERASRRPLPSAQTKKDAS